MLSKWNMLIDLALCLCCNLFWSCYANVVLYCDTTVSVNLLQRRRRCQECESCSPIIEICFVCVEFCANGVVLLMFGFFYTSGNPIEVSR